MFGSKTRSSRAHVAAFAGVVAAIVLVGAGTGASAASKASAHVRPNAVGLLDCNGFSPIQRSVKPTMLCADPSLSRTVRLEDHGHYIGHDEPSLRFISSRPGSGSDVTFVETLGKDPRALPTTGHPGSDITHNFELTVAPWFSMELCDPHSDPQLPCTPRSDANAPHGSFPGGGSAFMELQFYPPGFAPFSDSISCDNTHWCSALTIDSVECSFTGSCNNNCIEPVNFAFIQRDGVPTGPPSPQKSNFASVTPNAQTLMMNQGDRVVIHMFDARVAGGRALKITEHDLTTGQTGEMIASARNGFMNTSIADCTGTPFNFQPSYATARSQNIVPWGFGPYGINTEFEIGHFEPCTTLTGKSSLQNGPTTDTFFNVCHGPYESDAPPDTPKSQEPNDSPCYPRGDTHGGTVPPNQVTGCDVFFGAVGDLDFDGTPYRTDWPTSVRPNRYPATFQQATPTSGGHAYEQIQFMTDVSASESACNLTSGAGCVMPPTGPGRFYPFWTRASVNGACVWEFGNMRNGNTFGGVRQYGRVAPRTLGAFTSRIKATPAC
jgi:hypothetical protein